MNRYQAYIRGIPGKGRVDLTPLYLDPVVLKEVSRDLAAPFADKGITKVLALDAQGFGLGALVAFHLDAGLVSVRKGGKVAWRIKDIEVIDYSRKPKKLEIAEDAVGEKDKVLVIDDWSETGAQIRGAIALAEQCGATVIGAAAINMDAPVLQDERLSRYLLHAVCRFTSLNQ